MQLDPNSIAISMYDNLDRQTLYSGICCWISLELSQYWRETGHL